MPGFWRETSTRGHRIEPATYPIHLGGHQSQGYFCANCGRDLEAEARGKYRHLETRDGAKWLEGLQPHA